MGTEGSRLPAALSAAYATILLLVVAHVVMNKLSIWNQLGTGEKSWTIFASAYATVLAASGWLYGLSGFRVVGLTHALLMLGIAGLVLYGVFGGWVSGPGSDDPAAGIVATANVVFIIIGVLAAICGIALMRCVFPGKKSSADTE